MKLKAWKAMVVVLKDEVSDIKLLEKLKRRFENLFRHDKDGVPRVWSQNDDIESFYSQAKREVVFFNKAESLLDLLSHINVDLDKIDPDISLNEVIDSMKLLSPSKQQTVKLLFNREAESLFIEAKRSTIVSNGMIPTWFIIITIILGWNELMAIIRYPFLTLLLLIAFGCVYILYYTNLGGPALQVAKATTIEMLKQGKEQLNYHFSGNFQEKVKVDNIKNSSKKRE